ncbi:MAG: hypothetical protein A2Y86_04070 [Candidatus Aminicenantes bacterium RBG_13_62_12]|nr:MAG: hypothetical protein A2Y86_04070 [Candidatus Aminicenantes bacterium RBG_13_62_12]
MPMHVRQISKVRYLSGLYERIAAVEGSVVECGVGKGITLLILTALALSEGKGRSVWGFDSFEGFPEPTSQDASARMPKKGEWSGTSPEDIRLFLEKAGISREDIGRAVTLVPGFFENSLSSYDGSPIAFLHVDVDLYESYHAVLKSLFRFVSPGGVILFDEYGDYKWPGAKKAVDAFLRGKHRHLEQEALSGKYFIIKGAYRMMKTDISPSAEHPEGSF